MAKTHAMFFKMLSSRTRIEILKILRDNEGLTVDELSSRLHVTATTVSRHLQLMRIQDIVTFRQDAQSRYYEVNEEEIAKRIGLFLKHLSIEL
jgi:DNA-binding transcriptional ArsR family regulator